MSSTELSKFCFVLVIKCILLLSVIPTSDSQSICDCKVITECAPLMAILRRQFKTPKEVQELKNSQCGSQGRLAKVCCPSSECITPDQREGTCTDIYDCKQLLQLVSHPKPIPESIKEFLKKSSCLGLARVSVCCARKKSSGQGQADRVGVDPPKDQDKVNVNVDNILPSVCGKSGEEDRIIGGEETGIDQYPWMALIEYRTALRTLQTSCAASLISARYLLTAGHCLVGSIIKLVGNPESVRLGEYDTSTKTDCVDLAGGGEDCADVAVSIDIEYTTVHPNFELTKSGGIKNDVGIIRIVRDAPQTFYIHPICLPESDIYKSRSKPIKTLVVAGWGSTDPIKSIPSNVKMQVILPLVELDECEKRYTTINKTLGLSDKEVCAGGVKGKDSCRGDSGGPLAHAELGSDTYKLIGIVSYGETSCGTNGLPGVYMNVFKYLDWIKRELKP